MERNRATFDRAAVDYRTRELEPAERAFLARFRDRWAASSLLDLGVGAGRTAWTFAALVRRYVGVDYSPSMIEMARRLIIPGESVELYLADFRDLSALFEERFDFVLASYNSLDYVSHDDRLRVLRQVRGLLREDGHLFFSSHSLHSFPFKLPAPPFDPRRPASSLARRATEALRALRLSWIHRRTDPEALRARGWAILDDGAHGFGLSTYYVLPRYQEEQLEEAGLELVAAYDRAGQLLDARTTRAGGWIHYLARPRAAPAP